MSKIALTLRSRTFWTIVLLFVIGGFDSISNVIPAGMATPVEGVLALLAAYFHVNPSQQYK